MVMNDTVKDFRIKTQKNYYLYFFTVTIISAIALTIIQITKPSLFLAILIFLLIESYFVLRRQVVEVFINDDEISLEYFQFLKKICTSSSIKNVKITRNYEVSNVTGNKRATLKILIKGKRFSVDVLDGFDEDDLLLLYDFFAKRSKNGT
jgi:hypothetical protein